MRALLAGLSMVLLGAAPAPDLSWIVDSELGTREELARSQAETLDAQAADLDAQRADLERKAGTAREEKLRVEATLAEQSRVKRGLSESRIKELDAQIGAWEVRIQSMTQQAARARKDAEARRALAANISAEAATRAKQEADAVPSTDAEALSALSDARLRAAKAFYARRMARVPVQIAALEKMARDPGTTPAARASLVGQMGEVRGLREEDAAVLALLDEEIRFRAETKADEGAQAALLEQAASVKAGATETATPLLVTAERSKELDVALDRMIAAEDEAALRKKSRSRMQHLAMRWGIGTVVLAGAGGLLWLFAFRKMS